MQLHSGIEDVDSVGMITLCCTPDTLYPNPPGPGARDRRGTREANDIEVIPSEIVPS